MSFSNDGAPMSAWSARLREWMADRDLLKKP
jgi:hypothetical protein